MLGVGPVVRDLLVRMVSHDVVLAAIVLGKSFGRGHESPHVVGGLVADVAEGVGVGVRAADVLVRGAVVGIVVAARVRIKILASSRGQTVGTRIGAEIGVERTVLLHDENEMLKLRIRGRQQHARLQLIHAENGTAKNSTRTDG